MLYLLIIGFVWCAVVFWGNLEYLNLYFDVPTKKEELALYKERKRHMCLSLILLIVFFISAIVGTVIVCNSNFLSMTTDESSNTYQVTEFSAEKSTYNLVGDYETKYSITIEDNFLIEISTRDVGVEVICNNYNPTTVTFEEKHYFKWWFLSPYASYTYTLS